ncbi:GspH/FimT family pseudopilin [Marinobacter sp. OP 3.4]|uniref:GspH/FimT family pseudopilin n=1 Tax=Marinobacter sp. OP 3.4 TaxID=3076501 RepID=UPI002E21368F
MQKSSGFTLIELMVALFVLVIMVTIAIPSFQSVISGSQLEESRDSLRSAIRYAKSEAIALNRIVSVCPSSDGASCGDKSNWPDGWLVVTDSNQTGSVSIDDVLRVFEGPDSGDVTVTDDGSLNYIRFRPDGLAENLSGSSRLFGFCDPDDNTAPKSLVVATTTGAVSTGTEAQADCP